MLFNIKFYYSVCVSILLSVWRSVGWSIGRLPSRWLAWHSMNDPAAGARFPLSIHILWEKKILMSPFLFISFFRFVRGMDIHRNRFGWSNTLGPCSKPCLTCYALATVDSRPSHWRTCGSRCCPWSAAPPATPFSSVMPPISFRASILPDVSTEKRYPITFILSDSLFFFKGKFWRVANHNWLSTREMENCSLNLVYFVFNNGWL